MKKLIFPIIAIFTLIACSKESSTTTPSIVVYGKWEVLKYEELINDTIDYSYSGKQNDFIEFKEDKKYILSIDEYYDGVLDSGTFEINGNSLLFDSTDTWFLTSTTSTLATLKRSKIVQSNKESFIFYLNKLK
jgi:hypothetical protein